MIPIAKPQIGKEEKEAVEKVLESGMLASGQKTEEFEKRFAEYVGTKYAVATSSGTTALHLGLLSLGIQPGDEVIIPSFSFVATANAVLFCGAKPVFCDVDPLTFNMDPTELQQIITSKTKAVMPVHLYGQPAEIHPIIELADNINIIWDACQAHGATYDNKMIGSFGDIECFSFYPTKNMTTGEGGMITTNSMEIADLAISLRNHGREKTQWGYEHNRLGYNYRMTDINAVIGIEQLKKLPQNVKLRQRNASFYDDVLTNVNTPYVPNNMSPSYHQYTIKTDYRESIIQSLRKNEIGYGIYYPMPLHMYSHLAQYTNGRLDVSEALSKKVLSIPIHPSLTLQDLEKVADAIDEVKT